MSDAPTAGFDAEVFTLAEVYADALLAAADEKGQAEAVAAELADLLAYMDREPDFAAFLTADTVDDDARRPVLEKLFRGRMNDLLLNALQVLNNRRRMGILRAVARAVELRMEQRHHQQEVTVETAVPLADELRGRIARVVSERIGKEAILIEQVRPELIGGLVLHIGDTRVDASVATRLRMLEKRLLDRATVEVHRGGKYVVET
ncbi:MAG: ATP synthase F1 subunit delta [Phycisphaerae bacterium]|jgi:F-type H+-transporting ATPase subunit delta